MIAVRGAAAIVGLVAAVMAVTGGAGEKDARTSLVLEPVVRYVSEFNGASVVARPRPPGAPVPLVAYVNPPFIWPVQGPITSYNDSTHPLGIDIGLSEERSREIKAAAAGVVTFSGGFDDDSYGVHIIIDHGNGVETLYGHLAQRIVQEGTRVEQGQLIGIGGSTGKSDGVHLHFEVLKDGANFDPLDLLPASAPGTETLELDCGSDTLTIDAGSSVTFDLAGALVEGERITGISIHDAAGALVPPEILDAAANGPVSFDLWSGIAFVGPVSDDAYVVSVTASAGGAPAQTIECDVEVHTPRVTPSYYVGVAPARTKTPGVPATATPRPAIQESPAVQTTPAVLATNTPYPEFLTPTATPPASASPTRGPGQTATPVAASPTATSTPAP